MDDIRASAPGLCAVAHTCVQLVRVMMHTDATAACVGISGTSLVSFLSILYGSANLIYVVDHCLTSRHDQELLQACTT